MIDRKSSDKLILDRELASYYENNMKVVGKNKCFKKYRMELIIYFTLHRFKRIILCKKRRLIVYLLHIQLLLLYSIIS